MLALRICRAMHRNTELEKLKEDFIRNSEEQLSSMRVMTAEQMFSKAGRASIELLRAQVVSSYLLLALFLADS